MRLSIKSKPLKGECILVTPFSEIEGLHREVKQQQMINACCKMYNYYNFVSIGKFILQEPCLTMLLLEQMTSYLIDGPGSILLSLLLFP